MTSSAHIIHAHMLASKISWNYDLKNWKIRVFIVLTFLNRAARSLTVRDKTCQKMRYMVELLEAVAMQ